ncbi:NAD(P)/FAD-dependent oxidoreductase [Yinghuangia sp. YIM S10712]|uniref:NAD(P)/FAD-dependent oxidoreductase n=1 Tax=Yinghuangia sp. YIM S10712 TaxID=3436930 RepID=UPI003F53C1E0
MVGSGFTGLEMAAELRDRLRAVAAPHGAADEVRVVLLERDTAIGPGLGAGPRPVIAEALDRLGVETVLGATVAAVTEDTVRLTDGTRIPARLVVWTAGMRAHPLTEQIPAARDRLGRLAVDAYLRVDGVPQVYAAGDTAAATAEPGRVVMQSCQHAIPLCRHAGHNAAADLLGAPQTVFAPAPYVTCMDLGGAGAVFTTGWERTVALAGAEAKTLKRNITERWIYPPVHDAPELMRQADPGYVNGGSERADRDALVASRTANQRYSQPCWGPARSRISSSLEREFFRIGLRLPRCAAYGPPVRRAVRPYAMR